MENKNLIDIVKKQKLAVGKSFFLKHLQNEKITRGQAIYAKCYDCMGSYSDGRKDCEIPSCPLYPFMPYRPTNKKKRNKKKGGRK